MAAIPKSVNELNINLVRLLNWWRGGLQTQGSTIQILARDLFAMSSIWSLPLRDDCNLHRSAHINKGWLLTALQNILVGHPNLMNSYLNKFDS